MALESEPTVISGILLSDATIVEQGSQKRTLVGVFDQFGFPQFPGAYGRFFINVWVTNLEGRLSELDIVTRIQARGSAHVVFSNAVRLTFEERQFSRDTIVGLGIPVNGVAFPQPGTYTALILINEEEAGRRDFNVILQPEASHNANR